MVKEFKLTAIGIEITWNCNQKCSYCYLGCDKDNNSIKNEISTKQFEIIIDKIWNAGIRDIYLIGGEPTVHKEFSNILKILNKYKWQKKGLCTNGVELTSVQREEIANSFDYVSISIRGDKETTTKITKVSTSYDETLSTLKELSNLDIDIRIEIDLLPDYFSKFTDIIRILENNKIKFKCIDIHRIIPTGRASQSDVASIKKYQNLLQDMHNESEQNGYNITFEDCLPLCLFEKKLWKHINICQCGTSKLWIDPSGNARRCACSSGIIGNIFNENLKDIWDSKTMKEFHSYEWVDDECKKCKVFNKCLGGCSSSRGVEFFEKDIFSNFFKAVK